MRNQTILVDINKETCKILKYKQYDNNNILQIIVEENYKKINLNEYVGFAFFELPSGLIIKKECEIEDNVITIIIDNNVLSEEGKVLLDLTLSDGEDTITLFRINLVIEETIDRDEAIIIEAGWDIVAEIAKFDKAEEQRVDYESVRIANEADRQNEEMKRIANEKVRVVKESDRQNEEMKRIANENVRVAKEDERLINEIERQTTEELRIENEEGRVVAENTRAEFYEGFNDRLDAVDSQLEHKANQSDLVIERERINMLSRLNEGSTTGDAELIDGRISVEGTVYTSLGESIREQIKTATGDLIGLPYTLINGIFITYNTGLEETHNTSYNGSDYIELLPGAKYVYLTNINYNNKDSGGLAFYRENKVFLQGYQYDHETNIKIDVPSDAKYLRFTIRTDSPGKTVVYQECATSILNNKHDVDLMKNTLFNEIELTLEHPNSYIINGANVSLISQSGYNVSAPISVKKGDILAVIAQGYLRNVSIISEILENGGYRVLVASKDSQHIYYTYTVPRDMTICITTRNSIEWRLFKIVNTDVNNHANEINLDFSIGSGYIRWDTGNNQIDQYTTNLRATSYIDIEGYTKLYVYELNHRVTDLSGMAFYDANYNYISGVQYTPCVDLVVVVPPNAKYARFTIRNDSLGVTIAVNLKEHLNKIQLSTINTSDSFEYDLGELTPNYYIVYSNGKAMSHDNAVYQITDYIELKPGHTSIQVTHGKTNTDISGFAFYDKNKGFIQGVQNSANQINIVDIPENAVYIRCTIMDTVDGSLISTMNFKNNIYSLNEDVVEIKSKIKEDEISYNYCQIFHKIAGIGDSLMSGEIGTHRPGEPTRWLDCYNYSWLSNLCRITGAEAVHYSSGGRTVKSWLSGFLDKMKAETVKPSAYFIALGTNDRSYVTLGTEADCDTDAETFYGMYSKIIKEVKTFNPNATIFCCSLYFSPSDSGTIQYCDAIKYMANKYGCYYIDFLNAHPEYSQDGNVIREKFVANGHFTTHGYVRVGHEMLQLVNEVIYNNSEDFKFMSQHYMDLK